MSRAGIAEAGHSRGDHNHFWAGVGLTLVFSVLCVASAFWFIGLCLSCRVFVCFFYTAWSLSARTLPLPTKLKGAEVGLLDARPKKKSNKQTWPV